MAHKTKDEAAPGEPYHEDGFFVIPGVALPRALSFLRQTDDHEPICGRCGKPWPCGDAS